MGAATLAALTGAALMATAAAEPGVHRFPLVLPAALEAQRPALAETLLRAQRRLAAFAGRHGWERHVVESFVDHVELFADKAAFDRRVLELCGEPTGTKLPATYSAALERRVLVAVSPALYRANFPQGDEPDAYEKLFCHEMAHRLHVRVLGGDEEAMGPVWFYEGFALLAADQLAAVAPALSDDEVWTVVGAPERGSYLKYATVIRRFAALAPLVTMVDRAGRPGFVEYLRLLSSRGAGRALTRGA